MTMSNEQMMLLMQQMAQTTAQAVAQHLQQTMRSEDTTVKTFSKPKVFDGTDSSWPMWSWRLEATVASLGFETALSAAGAQKPDDMMSIVDMDVDVSRQGKQLYAMLVESCEGKAAALLRTCEKGNGFQCWAKLKQEYEGSAAVRFQGMLTGLMSPSWSEELSKDRSKDFSTLFLAWESQVAVYELQRGRPLDPDVKVAVVMRHAPEDIKVALRQAAHVIGDDYRKLRSVLDTYVKSGRDYNAAGVCVSTHTPSGKASSGGGVVPMDVGALSKGKEKGKGKGKDSGKDSWWSYGYGKAGGKGKTGAKGKAGEKGKKGGKSKQYPPGTVVSQSHQSQFRGYCNLCGAWGHKRSQCTSRVAGVDEQATTQNLVPPSSSSMASTTQIPMQSQQLAGQQLQQPSMNTQMSQRSVVRSVGHVQRFHLADDDDDESSSFVCGCCIQEGEGCCVPRCTERPEFTCCFEDCRHQMCDVHAMRIEGRLVCWHCLMRNFEPQRSYIGAVVRADQHIESTGCLVMLDSGSDEHCCPLWFGASVDIKQSCRQLVDVQGNWIHHYGERSLVLQLDTTDGERLEVVANFQVSDCQKPLLSVGKLLKTQGVELRLNRDDPMLVLGDRCVPILRQHNTLYMQVTSVADENKGESSTTVVGGLDDEMLWAYPEVQEKEMDDETTGQDELQVDVYSEADPERLGTEHGPLYEYKDGAAERIGFDYSSRVVDIKKRMRELHISTHGTKAELLKRLQWHESVIAHRRDLKGFLLERHSALREGLRPYVPVLLPSPESPTIEQREAHIAQGHAVYEKW
eukprot:6479190-Amphidinium_carterae.1